MKRYRQDSNGGYDGHRGEGDFKRARDGDTEAFLSVPIAMIPALVGKKGSAISHLCQTTGANIQFGARDDEKNGVREVVFKGSSQSVLNAQVAMLQKIQSFAEQNPNDYNDLTEKTQSEILVPVSKVRSIIGAKGSNIQYVEKSSGVRLQIPRDHSSAADAQAVCEVTGTTLQINLADVLIKGLLKNTLYQQDSPFDGGNVPRFDNMRNQPPPSMERSFGNSGGRPGFDRYDRPAPVYDRPAPSYDRPQSGYDRPQHGFEPHVYDRYSNGRDRNDNFSRSNDYHQRAPDFPPPRRHEEPRLPPHLSKPFPNSGMETPNMHSRQSSAHPMMAFDGSKLAFLMPADGASRLIGKQGSIIKDLMNESGAHIQVNRDILTLESVRRGNVCPHGGFKVVEIKGDRDNQIMAVSLCLNKSDSELVILMIPKRKAAILVGKKGSGLTQLAEASQNSEFTPKQLQVCDTSNGNAAFTIGRLDGWEHVLQSSLERLESDVSYQRD